MSDLNSANHEAIGYIKQLKEIAPGKPWFVYYVPGATHAPHHPTPEWVKKISAMHLFDEGWNKVRETIFANQKRLGIMPVSAQLTPWPNDLPQWDSLSWDEKKLFVRQADIYGAYLAYTDHEIGRVIQEVEDLGELDNTLIIYIGGDNGASAEGMLNGTPNEFTTFDGIAVPVKDQFLWYPFWGSERTYPHYAAEWAWAMDTPINWVKQVASHFGGTAQGMVISWPGHITDLGGMRRQFSHVIDIVPTILEATGIPAPDTIDGIKQRPIEGGEHGLHVRQDQRRCPDPTHDAIFRDARQSGHLSRWVVGLHDACDPAVGAKHQDTSRRDYRLQVGTLPRRPEFNDLADKMPDKVKELQDLFYEEAKKYDALPLDNSTITRWNTPRPEPNGRSNRFRVLRRASWHTGECRYGLFLSKGEFGVGRGKLIFLYNLLDLKRTIWEGPELEPGKHTIVFDFKPDGPGLGKGGTGVLSVDGKEVVRNTLDHTTPVTFPEDESFDVGLDTRTGVAMFEYRYDVPFKFTGKIDKLTFHLEPERHAEANP
jgi:arylsulfatase